MYIISIRCVRIRKTINAAGDEERGRWKGRKRKRERENDRKQLFDDVPARCPLGPHQSRSGPFNWYYLARFAAINNDTSVQRRLVRCPFRSGFCTPPLAGFARGLFLFQINAGDARVIYPLAFFFIGISALRPLFLSPLFFARRTKDRPETPTQRHKDHYDSSNRDNWDKNNPRALCDCDKFLNPSLRFKLMYKVTEIDETNLVSW